MGSAEIPRLEVIALQLSFLREIKIDTDKILYTEWWQINRKPNDSELILQMAFTHVNRVLTLIIEMLENEYAGEIPAYTTQGMLYYLRQSTTTDVNPRREPHSTLKHILDDVQIKILDYIIEEFKLISICSHSVHI